MMGRLGWKIAKETAKFCRRMWWLDRVYLRRGKNPRSWHPFRVLPLRNEGCAIEGRRTGRRRCLGKIHDIMCVTFVCLFIKFNKNRLRPVRAVTWMFFGPSLLSRGTLSVSNLESFGFWDTDDNVDLESLTRATLVRNFQSESDIKPPMKKRRR